ncbi:MAG: hypothetical protein ABEJ87_00950 [Candidatus Nanohalobium sp.]
MSTANFDEIFGPGEFDNEENTYEREFLGVEAGGTRNVLDFDTVWEHANRHGYDVTPHPNGTSKDLQINRGNMDIYVENFPDGRTSLKIDFDDSIDNLEAYMRGSGNNGSVDQWLGEIIRREQKAYHAATRYLHNILPGKAREEGLTERQLLSRQLDFPKGGSLSRFHDEYRSGMPSDVAMSYAAEFEVWPFEKDESRRSDLPGKMPYRQELEDPGLRPRNDLYQRKFLESLIREAEDVHGVEDELRGKWMDYVDVTYS